MLFIDGIIFIFYVMNFLVVDKVLKVDWEVILFDIKVVFFDVNKVLEFVNEF